MPRKQLSCEPDGINDVTASLHYEEFFVDQFLPLSGLNHTCCMKFSHPQRKLVPFFSAARWWYIETAASFGCLIGTTTFEFFSIHCGNESGIKWLLNILGFGHCSRLSRETHSRNVSILLLCSHTLLSFPMIIRIISHSQWVPAKKWENRRYCFIMRVPC